MCAFAAIMIVRNIPVPPTAAPSLLRLDNTPTVTTSGEVSAWKCFANSIVQCLIRLPDLMAIAAGANPDSALGVLHALTSTPADTVASAYPLIQCYNAAQAAPTAVLKDGVQQDCVVLFC
jgi:hypothetical protein